MPEVYVFNIPRLYEEHFNYGALESIKDGIIFSGKYTSVTFPLPTPNKVFVFANFPPDRTKLSADRWAVTHLNAECDLVPPPIVIVNTKRPRAVTTNAPPPMEIVGKLPREWQPDPPARLIAEFENTAVAEKKRRPP